MQTTAGDNATDTQHLLHDKDSNLKRRWSTFQLVFFVIIAIIVTGLATNMDRIVDQINDSSEDSSSNEPAEPSCNYEFGHSAKACFALAEDYTEFNFGAYGMKDIMYTKTCHIQTAYNTKNR